MPKAAVYIRVSTEDQTTANQLPEIKDFCRRQGWEIAGIYAENESAWRQGHQTELARLLSELRHGRRHYDYLVVYALDRLSRGGIGVLLTLINAFENARCNVVSVKEAWTFNTGQMRELFVAIIGFAAKYESDRKSENTKAGLKRKMANGWRPGRPKGSRDKKQRRKRRVVIRV